MDKPWSICAPPLPLLEIGVVWTSMWNVNVAVTCGSSGGMDHDPLGQLIYPEIEVAVWPIMRVVGVEGEHNRNFLQPEPEEKRDDVLTIKSIFKVYVNQINLGAH
jgi:hypothetical protein